MSDDQRAGGPAPKPENAQPPATRPITQPSTTPSAEPVPPAGAAQVTTTSRVRSLMVGLAFLFTMLSLVLATTTWWLHDTVLDTDRFVTLTAPLVDDPAVQEELVTVTATQLDEALGLGPIATYAVTGISREVYASDAFADLWAGAMRQVHSRVVAILRGDSARIQTDNGQIVLNLFPLYDRVVDRINGLGIEIAGRTIQAPAITNPEDPDASRAELSAALGRELSPTFGTVPIGDATKLEAAQRYVSIFDALVVVLFIATAAFALLTLALARRRIAMVALLGIGSLAALLAARLVVGSAADEISTAIATGGPGAVIGGQVVLDVAQSYREFARWVLLIALVAAVAATATAWLIERRARPETGGEAGSILDGWFLAFVGMSVALAALLLVGLTGVTLVLVGIALLVWLVAVIAWRRSIESAALP
jgi:hypothetical protein